MTDDARTKLRVIVLGCGSSPGTPRVNGDWGACDPKNPKNHRLRASILIEQITASGRTTVVIDTGPDFRTQMLNANVSQIDAVVYTHAHADHIHGIDDLRTYVLAQGEMIPVYTDAPTSARLHQAFGYCFERPEGSGYPPILLDRRIAPETPFEIGGQGGPITLLPLLQQHGSIHSLGFRMGDFAYCPDVSAFPDATLEKMAGLDVLIIDALQYREHPSHLSLAQSLAIIDHLKPGKAYLTHMHIPLDYETVLAETPRHVAPCYDGMVIEL